MTVIPVTGETKFYALIGHPVQQVRTPSVLNAYLKKHEIDAIMVTFDLLPEAVKSFFKMLRGCENCLGCCVTIPHKTIAFESVDKVTERSQRIGAVNIIRRETSGQLIGDMTDGQGFLAALKKHNSVVSKKHVVLIGAGGAGSAIADSIANAGARELSILEINKPRQKTLISTLTQCYPNVIFNDIAGDPSTIQVLINASPLGMAKEDALPFPLDGLPRDAIIADVITKPDVTPLLELARKTGHTIQRGKEMAEAQLPMFLDFLNIPEKN